MNRPDVYPFQVASTMDLSGEEWRFVAGLEGLYEVSSMGRVRSLDRSIPDRNGRVVRYRGVMRRQSLDGSVGGGYPVVSLMRIPDAQGRDRKRVVRTHLLVAEAFLGPKPEGMLVRHLNGDPRDARLVNLRYGTASENQIDRVRHGTDIRGERHPNSKLTQAQVNAVRELMENCFSAEKVANLFNIHPSHVHALASKQWWNHNDEFPDQPNVPPMPDLIEYTGSPLASESGEEWRDVSGWEDRYQVSTRGRVRSLLRGGMILRPVEGRYGHLRLTLTKNGQAEAALVHRLVAEAFIGPPPFERALALHMDGDPKNNQPSNIRWGTYADNAEDARRHGTQGPGELNPNRHVSDDIVREIRSLAADGIPYSTIGNQFGITRTQASHIARGKAWAHLDDTPAVPKRRDYVEPLSPFQRKKILGLRAEGMRVVDVAKRTGVSPSTVSRLTTDGILTAQRERTSAVAAEVRDLVAKGMSQKAAAERFGISRAAVCRIVKNKARLD